MDLQSPSVLAQLPRPLHASTGKTRISDVFSLADAKKRKRYEVAVAVDGEAVNIYNVRFPKASVFRMQTDSDLSGSNAKARNFLRRPAAIYILLPPMLRSPQAVEKVGSSETNLYCRY